MPQLGKAATNQGLEEALVPLLPKKTRIIALRWGSRGTQKAPRWQQHVVSFSPCCMDPACVLGLGGTSESHSLIMGTC